MLQNLTLPAEDQPPRRSYNASETCLGLASEGLQGEEVPE